MESDGPYQHIRFPRFEGKPKCSMSCPACAYAEGRKAAEKDFKELLWLANKLKQGGSYFPDGLEDEFIAWKKARGIE